MPTLSFDATTISFIVLGALIALLALWILRLELKLFRLRAGTSRERLDDIMTQIMRTLKDLYEFRDHTDKRMEDAEHKLKSSIRHVETLRFNPFEGTGSGGNQSFASAFVNEEGDGVVISSLYARDRMSVYSKPLSQFSSAYELSEEEKEAIERARKTLTQQ